MLGGTQLPHGGSTLAVAGKLNAALALLVPVAPPLQVAGTVAVPSSTSFQAQGRTTLAPLKVLLYAPEARI
ncbi:hypothetical protein G6F66_015708 [Rhizopus arrhizus]|nr:hypothetical protein G6F66_015708 [Rhizopus arrhizus]